MTWPHSQDYNEVIQNPRHNLSDPELREGTVVTNALGLPVPRSGNFADVYEFLCPASQGRYAVKCFTREVPGLRERYSEISRHLEAVRLPFTVEFQYQAEGIRVGSRWYPLLKMQWVEGLLLNEFVRTALDKPVILDGLVQIWTRMARWLCEAKVAHGDLQHGNVMLVPGSKTLSLAVKLIDYDGMYVPALAEVPSREVGHPAFQHPQRLRDGLYNSEVDRFSLLVVATALRSLMAGGCRLWERYDNGDNLLFRETDLKTPGQSALFKELWQLKDPTAHTLVGHLALGCLDRPEQVPRLEELFANGTPPGLGAGEERQVASLLGFATVCTIPPAVEPIAPATAEGVSPVPHTDDPLEVEPVPSAADPESSEPGLRLRCGFSGSGVTDPEKTGTALEPGLGLCPGHHGRGPGRPHGGDPGLWPPNALVRNRAAGPDHLAEGNQAPGNQFRTGRSPDPAGGPSGRDPGPGLFGGRPGSAHRRRRPDGLSVGRPPG